MVTLGKAVVLGEEAPIPTPCPPSSHAYALILSSVTRQAGLLSLPAALIKLQRLVSS